MQTEAIFENIADRISNELNKAEHSIYIAVAWFTNRNLFEILLKKAQQGITVQLMISNDQINIDSYNDYSQLNIGSSAAFLIGDGKKDLMHNKFCIIDSYTVINGSYNWSYKAEKNHENILITKADEILAKQFIKQFKNIRDSYFKYEEAALDIPLDKVIKRLEILKNYVILEDIEDVQRETTKLKAFNFHKAILSITLALQTHNFGDAIELIDKFIKDHHSLVLYNDVDVAALKLEIRQLEHQLNAFDNERIELNKIIAEFYHRHTMELGGYIQRLLYLRKLHAKEDPDKYAEAIKEEEDYNEQVKGESEKILHHLSDDERLYLKKLYRKASQICHPDRVSEDMKDIAQEVFVQLNQAYNENDLNEVEKILSDLKKGMFKPRSETVGEKGQLKAIITTLRYKVAKVEAEIFAIKDSEDYKTISTLTDWDEYFNLKKAQLKSEVESFESEYF